MAVPSHDQCSLQEELASYSSAKARDRNRAPWRNQENSVRLTVHRVPSYHSSTAAGAWGGVRVQRHSWQQERQ